MTNDALLLELGNWLLIYAAIPQTLFVIAYSRAPWRSTPIGKALMLKGVALAFVLDWAFVVQVFGFGTFPFALLLRAALFALVAAGVTFQCYVVVVTQWRGDREHHSHGHPLAARDSHNDGRRAVDEGSDA